MAPETSDDEGAGAADPETPDEEPTGVSIGSMRRTLTSRLSSAFVYQPKPATADDSEDDENEEEVGDHGAKAPPQRRMTDREKGEAIRQVDKNERWIGFAGAAAIALIGLVYFIPYVSNPRRGVANTISRTGKTCPAHYKAIVSNGTHECLQYVYHTRSSWVLEMCIVLAFALFVLVATRVGKRSLLAFALLFSGLAVETLTGSFIGLLFLLGGGWLMVRAYRVQKYGTTSGREVAQIAAERRAEQKGRRSSSSRGGRGTTARAAKAPAQSKKGASPQTTASGRPRPEASKRYTPKAPPRKKPPPPE